MSRVAQVHRLRHCTCTRFGTTSPISKNVGMGGESCAYASCRFWLGLSFEPLTAFVRSKLDLGGHVACCSGASASAPDSGQPAQFSKMSVWEVSLVHMLRVGFG
jgi:hypothetical protein